MFKKRKLIKLKENIFNQNGGILLQQQLSKQSESCDATKIFNKKELKKSLIKLKENIFNQNGGILLQQQLSKQSGSCDTTKIFNKKNSRSRPTTLMRKESLVEEATEPYTKDT
ncbi:hypothetical protein Dsin_008193 [Dipteronia sinensis]|uniref:Uncharacterized protein n=1 Tax=Dipteronia sinensis TaxID=43782 RepID=A0AAE0B238_9ROSI|nr:hypothetical protein Dsin_008193 [Dipteronia sinensis]